MLVALAGVSVLVFLAVRAQHQAADTKSAIDRFQRTLQPALLRVRDETTRTQRRIPPDPR
jgi:hypothetical protein